MTWGETFKKVWEEKVKKITDKSIKRILQKKAENNADVNHYSSLN